MRTLTAETTATRNARRSILAAAALIASVGVAAAKDKQPSQPPAAASQYYGLSQDPTGLAPSRADRINFDRSGTRGRDGLGESPFHPEGPGNVSD